jgi:hypothetical protein
MARNEDTSNTTNLPGSKNLAGFVLVFEIFSLTGAYSPHRVM